MKAWAIAVALLLACCAQDHTPLEDRVTSAVFDAWAEAGLREPVDWCRLEHFRIVVAKSLTRFREGCQVDDSVACARLPNACMVWRIEKGRVRSLRYPVAYVSPQFATEHPDRVAAVAIHELAHAFLYCASLSPSRLDWYDHWHTLDEVWESGGPDSVETRAERIVYGY